MGEEQARNRSGHHSTTAGGKRRDLKRPDVIAWLGTRPPLDELCVAFPGEWAAVQRSIADMRQRGAKDELVQALRAAQAPAPTMRDRQVSLDGRISTEVRRQMLLQSVRRASLVASTGVTSGTVRFGLVNGWMLQRLLFRRALERKPVRIHLFRVLWPLMGQRRLLMPLVRPQGIYCFYSAELLSRLKQLVDGRRCVEIAAGDGTLSRFLRDAGVDVVATDDGSWRDAIEYPPDVVQESARTSLATRSPQVVICSWPPTDNDFERLVFNTRSVDLYIVLSSTVEINAGNWAAYRAQNDFTMTADDGLSRLLLPPETSPGVLIFQRRSTEQV